jgi:tRNA threonylcarbamoyl adenosine modification protein YeaZ
MANALAIDTTSDMLSLAVVRQGAPPVGHYEVCGTAIARTILHEIERLLAKAEVSAATLDVILVACGPGSFTGTRIGMSVALTLGRVLQRPVIGVDTLTILASQVDPEFPGTFCALLNCARDEVYQAAFRWRDGQLEAQGAIGLTTFALAAETLGRTPCVLRRFDPTPPEPESDLSLRIASLVPAPLRFPQPDALRLLAAGLPRYLAQPGGPFDPPAPIYLKSEAFRTWRPPGEPASALGVTPPAPDSGAR